MQFRVFRDLKRRPLKGEIEDTAKLQERIFWIEDKEKSVKELAKAMQLKEVPKYIAAFFPEKLEKELLEKELKYQNRKEDEILETQFRVVLREGTYEIEVVEQKLKNE